MQPKTASSGAVDRRGGPAAVALVLAILSAVGVAHADDAAEAQLHFQIGTVDFREHRYEEALGHFLAANRLAPTANTIFDVAQSYLALSRDADAYRFLRDYMNHPGATDANRAIASAAIARIEPLIARLEVVSTPPGAAIYVDRVDVGDVGTTPRMMAVTAGAHEVIVRLAGYREMRTSVTGTVGQSVRVDTTLSQIVGSLHIATTPPGAAVQVDGHDAGVSPLSVSVSPGVHRVLLRREGYLDVSREIESAAEQTSTIDESLPVDLGRSGVLSVVSTPAGASVRLRGAAMGTTPVSASAMLPGPADVDVERPGSVPLHQNVFVRVGHEETLRVTLGRPGAHRPLWIHALGVVGALAIIGGLVTGGFAISEHASFNQDPDTSTLNLTNSLNVAADVTTIAGIVLLAAGVTAFALTPDPSASRADVVDEVLHARAQ